MISTQVKNHHYLTLHYRYYRNSKGAVKQDHPDDPDAKNMYGRPWLHLDCGIVRYAGVVRRALGPVKKSTTESGIPEVFSSGSTSAAS